MDNWIYQTLPETVFVDLERKKSYLLKLMSCLLTWLTWNYNKINIKCREIKITLKLLKWIL